GKWTPETLPHYNLIVGEAKGLRAYLHLDLLRIFGPVLPDGMDQPSIPYRDEFSNNIIRQMSARDVLAKIEKDLKEARDLLADDPINEHGRQNPDYSDNSSENKVYAYRFRGIRMNYYAVCATLARYYLLIGNKSEALTYALEVINADKIFQLGNAKSNTQDYMFQPELVWAIYDAEINKQGHLGNSDFFINYSISDLFRSFVYGEGYGLPDDPRLNHWWGQTATAPVIHYLSKYFRTTDLNTNTDITKWEKLISMIRLSELYYIAAEANIGTDNAEARRLLQAVRNARNLATSPLPETLTEAELLEQIVFEQLKEFWGEGKLFYTYKRLFRDIIIRQNTIPASKAIFELPVPREEIEYGNN
ncbi:MAG: RagB/SusD family nutrient uptake outer membrane protein, partial [Odoribacteraceae bacterium]|nr:RagB/SusD family nutrient uptake outer membrane protein [Odoribacteraceae bacterium]